MDKKKGQNQNKKAEIAEEFDTHRPMMEREINALVGQRKKVKKGEEQDEKTKKIQSESKNSTR